MELLSKNLEYLLIKIPSMMRRLKYLAELLDLVYLYPWFLPVQFPLRSKICESSNSRILFIPRVHITMVKNSFSCEERFIAEYHTRRKFRILVYSPQEIFTESFSSRIVFLSQILHVSIMICVQFFFFQDPLYCRVRQIMLPSNKPNTCFRLLFDSTSTFRKFLSLQSLPQSFLFDKKLPVSYNRRAAPSITAADRYLTLFGYNSWYLLAAT